MTRSHEGATPLNIAWVARDGYADLFPKIQQRLAGSVDTKAFYLCHTRDQAIHLAAHHDISDAVVIAKGVAAFEPSQTPSQELDEFAKKYGGVPLIRCLWSTMFELNIDEAEVAKQALGHFKFWEGYLLENDIDVLVYERPSIMSSCIAWLVCQQLGVEALDFVDTAVDTMTITTSWRGDYAEELKESLGAGIDEGSESYARAVEYVDRMRSRPTKTNEALLASEITDRRGTMSVQKIKNTFVKLREHDSKKEYFIYKNFFGANVVRSAKYIARYNFHKIVNVFAKDIDPVNDRYFLFPLFMTGEWSNHVFMSLGYWDQVGTIRHIAQCLPVGTYLYVKEHHSMFAEHSLGFYREIKKIRNVRLVSPFADTFHLIENSQGVVTLGSTMGFEALLMKKPVLLLGEPWYRVFPGLRRVDSPYEIAHFMQHLDEIEILTREECINLVHAIYQVSFEGIKCPRPGTLSDSNVASFVDALTKHLQGRRVAT